MVYPVVLGVGYVCTQVTFHYPICTFGLAICFRMVGKENFILILYYLHSHRYNVTVIWPPWSLTVINRNPYKANTQRYITSMNLLMCRVLSGLYKCFFVSQSTITRYIEKHSFVAGILEILQQNRATNSSTSCLKSVAGWKNLVFEPCRPWYVYTLSSLMHTAYNVWLSQTRSS